MTAWVEVSIELLRRQAEAASAVLFDLGATGVQEDHRPGEAPPPRQPWDEGPLPEPTLWVVLRSWWPKDGFDQVWVSIREGLSPFGEATTARVDDVDWLKQWRMGFQPIHISDRLVVSPPWLAREGDLIVDPGMAFGTGDHPTTRACLSAIDRYAKAGERCLDVGTGSGVLAIAAARLGMNACGVDTDPLAIKEAHENAERNGVVIQVDGRSLADIHGSFALVVANIYAEVLVLLAPDLIRLCGGRMALAGILIDREHMVQDAMSTLRLVEREVEGDWVSLVFQR